MIRGPYVNLVETELSDKRIVYQWCCESDITKTMMGAPLFPDVPVPSWEKFAQDYQDYFFDGTKPLSGRCYYIEARNQKAGIISYNDIAKDDEGTLFCELDIWMKSENFCGKGYGSAAIITMSDYLKKEFGIIYLMMQPSRRNPRGIRAHEKAGFREIAISIEEALKKFNSNDYYDSVYMLKYL